MLCLKKMNFEVSFVGPVLRMTGGIISQPDARWSITLGEVAVVAAVNSYPIDRAISVLCGELLRADNLPIDLLDAAVAALLFRCDLPGCHPTLH